MTMTHEQVRAMVAEMCIPYAYDHFVEGECPDPPFICFLYPGSDNFGADDIVYHKASELHIELYTDRKNPELESFVEDILMAHEIFYEKSEVWINSEQMYEVLYTMMV